MFSQSLYANKNPIKVFKNISVEGLIGNRLTLNPTSIKVFSGFRSAFAPLLWHRGNKHAPFHGSLPYQRITVHCADTHIQSPICSYRYIDIYLSGGVGGKGRGWSWTELEMRVHAGVLSKQCCPPFCCFSQWILSFRQPHPDLTFSNSISSSEWYWDGD